MRHQLLFLAVGLSLSGCATERFGADVVRFHSGFAAQQGQTLSVRPVDPALAGSLEFAAYGNQLAERLVRLGFKAIASGPADIVAELSYSQVTRDTSVDAGGRPPVNVGVGVGGGSGTFGLGGSINFPIGKARETNRGVRDTMVSVRLKRSGEDKILWEGRATAESLNVETNTLTALMPDMLDALLFSFPGESGKSIRYKPAATTSK